MKAFVFHGAGQPAGKGVPDPAGKDPTDTAVRADSVTIRAARPAAAGRLLTSRPVTRPFPRDRVAEACDVFARGAGAGVLTFVLGGDWHAVVALSG